VGLDEKLHTTEKCDKRQNASVGTIKIMKHPSLRVNAHLSDKMGFRDILARIDRAIQVDHGPVENKTQLFLTKY
jgi:hypothetical protein